MSVGVVLALTFSLRADFEATGRDDYPLQTASGFSFRSSIKLPTIALDALRRHREEHGGDGWLFKTSGDKPVAAHNFHKCGWRPSLRKAGLPETLTYHRLRHGAASLLLSEGVPIPVVSRYLGHSNPSTTMRAYAHVIDGLEGMAAQRIDQVYPSL